MSVVFSRRSFIGTSLAATALTAQQLAAQEAKATKLSLAGELGVTTGSFMRHQRADPTLHQTLLLDLPRRMREELDLRVIDLMTANFASFDPKYLDELRSRAERHGCILTNLKMNQAVDMASPDTAARRSALDEYRRSIDAAHRLGCRWVRPAPAGQRPDLKLLADGYRELIEYAAPKGISLLVENNAWLRDDPEAIPAVIAAVGPGVAAAPDTGNWTDAARFTGLAKAFPLAVTCDFKALQFDKQGGHSQYDLKRCFQTGWDAGFRGPWCFEHFNESLDGLWRGFARLRDLLRSWMKAG